MREAGGEHVVDPEPEAQEAGAHRRQNDPGIADDGSLREGWHDHRHQRDGWQKDDVDFRMAEDPEKVLPQERITAALRIEEGPVEHALHLEQQIPRNQWRKGKQDHACHDKQVPGKERHHVDAHAGSAALHDADDEFHGSSD